MEQARVTEEAFVPVSVTTLRSEALRGVSLYLRNMQGQLQLYRDKSVALEDNDLRQLNDRGASQVYVPTDDFVLYQDYLRGNLDALMEDETLPPRQRFGLLNDVVRAALKDSFRCGTTDQIVDQCDRLAEPIAEMICREDMVAGDLLSVMDHDYYTFTHSANVSYYCVLLAKALDLGTMEDYLKIAAAGLLHDLGKLEIPNSILCKRDRLTDRELKTIQMHPTLGFEELCDRDDLNYGQLMMVYQHHERPDGGGYPVGVTEGEIHPWARVCTVVDVYEALTATRPYRRRMSSDDAFGIMNRSKSAFDQEMLKCWKTTIKNS